MKYASVCSGVEAASLAWIPLGWEAAWFSEIEPFPCAVLKERFPNVPNLGDMTRIKVENLKNGDQRYTNADGRSVLVSGGVDLLVGGTPCQSFSVAGKREGLDGASGLARTFVELLGVMRPRWFVWENVPGCLSSRNKQTGIYDFNFLLAAFAEVGYTCGWRILDAQYVRVDGYPRAIPQRRRRVFVVGHLGAEWQYPAEVLFEPSCLCRNNPPKRIKAKNLTSDAQRCLGTASRPWGNSGVIENASAFDGSGMESGDVTPTLQANLGKLLSNQTPVILNDQGGSVMQIEQNGNAGTLRANTHGNEQIVCVHGAETPIFNTEEYATGGGNLPLVRECFVKTARPTFKGDCETYADTGVAPTVNCFDQGDKRANELVCDCYGVMGAANIATVRRLLPVECERLMGFPDNWTRIPWKGKPAEDCPDSPRYKACGNSMCVNVMRWIGLRIEQTKWLLGE